MNDKIQEQNRPDAKRFEFGQNWTRFVKKNFKQERCDIAMEKILKFSGRKDMKGLEVIDVGCGSGLHSLGMFQAGADKIHSLDYDQNSVNATRILHDYAKKPPNWTIERGDALDKPYLESLGKWDFVYSWGVLHHTGSMWEAIKNVADMAKPDGYFYIALYSSDADFQPSKEFWLEIKQKYVHGSWLKKKYMVLWYVWRFAMQKDIRRLPEVINRVISYRFNRGMNYFADIRDWLGGWPMEYAGDQETTDLMEQEFGYKLINVDTGQACSEFLFQRTGTPTEKTIVVDMIADKKAKIEAEKTAETSA